MWSEEVVLFEKQIVTEKQAELLVLLEGWDGRGWGGKEG